MEQIIVQEEHDYPTRTYILLGLNILGVFFCIATVFILIIWAQNLIFMEPEVTPALQPYDKPYRHAEDLTIENIETMLQKFYNGEDISKDFPNDMIIDNKPEDDMVTDAIVSTE